MISPPDRAAVDAAIDRTLALLHQRQQPSGAFRGTCVGGPQYSAIAIIALARANALDDVDRTEVLAYLRGRAGLMGGFASSPGAEPWDLSTTALVWAALASLGLPADDPDLMAAKAFVDSRGGVGAVSTLYAPFLGAAGLLPKDQLPPSMLFTQLIPGATWATSRLFNQWVNLMSTLQSLIISGLKQDAPPGWTHPFACLARTRALDRIHALQSPDGDLAGVLLITAMMVLAYAIQQDSGPALDRAVASLRSMRVKLGAHQQYTPFIGEVWNTAMVVRAAMRAGKDPSDPHLKPAIDWLLARQIRRDAPRSWQNPRAGAPRQGGWSFEATNVFNADCDTTAAVISALSLVLERSDRDDVRKAVERGVAWLLPMQNPDHGWPSMTRDNGKVAQEPFFTKPMQQPADLLAMLKLAIERPPEVTDPSTAGLTGRVVEGLVLAGVSPYHPALTHVPDFFAKQRIGERWWGRWGTNYVYGTACVLRGRQALQLDPNAEAQASGVAWLLARQNEDGGWGEDTVTYARPEASGPWPSRPDLTGNCIQALVDIGLGQHPAAHRAVHYLLDNQRATGAFRGAHGSLVVLPPDTFYRNPLLEIVTVLEGLAAWTGAARGGWAPTPHAEQAAQWTAALKRGDRAGDAVVRGLFEGGELKDVNALFRRLTANGQPLPDDLPPAVQTLFNTDAALPEDVDQDRIANAERLFGDYGPQIIASLFFAALPYAYAIHKGAAVLAGTGELVGDVARRILKTALFVTAVAEGGGMQADGGGVRAAQKVRLIHAAVRHLCTTQLDWDIDANNLPINQLDLVATALSFSLITSDSVIALGVPLTDQEQEDWLYLWVVVARLLGAEPELLPSTIAEARALDGWIRRTQHGPSDAGRRLTEALLDWVRSFIHWAPLRQLPELMTHFLSGPTIAEAIGVPMPKGGRAIIAVFRAADAIFARLLRHHRALEWIMAEVSRRVIAAMIRDASQGADLSLQVPPALRARWRVNPR